MLTGAVRVSPIVGTLLNVIHYGDTLLAAMLAPKTGVDLGPSSNV